MVPEQLSIVKLGLHILELLVGGRHDPHQLLNLHIGFVLLLLLHDVLLHNLQLLEGLRGETVFVDQFLLHQSVLDVLDVLGQNFYRLVDRLLHSGSLLLDYLLSFFEVVLQENILLFDQLKLSCIFG